MKQIRTNADRIRAMSDAELAELLENQAIVCQLDTEWCRKRVAGCKGCAKAWLESPAKTLIKKQEVKQ